jgi:uncharacterized membrane protein YkgB
MKRDSLIRLSKWVVQKNIPFVVTVAGMVFMLLWAGAFKMTNPGSDAITPLVTNSPLLNWHFKVFGSHLGSDLIGFTEVVAASLIIAGLFRPVAGIIGSCIAVLMFFSTSTMLISTPGTLIHVNGFPYMDMLGLFLFKDIILLGASFYLLGQFGDRTSTIISNT